MLKDATYKEKFAMIRSWMPLILDEIKKDLRNDHLRQDPGFAREYFAGKNLSKLNSMELAEGYSNAIENSEKSEQLAEYIANRWLLKHTDLYYYFEQELAKINPDFNEIHSIDNHTAAKILDGAVEQFGCIHTYLFSVLNSVVFAKEVYEKLAHEAKHYALKQEEEATAKQELESVEKMQRNHSQEIARLTDKYEKKLAGLQKKYTQDMETLKKQVAALQRKLPV